LLNCFTKGYSGLLSAVEEEEDEEAEEEAPKDEAEIQVGGGAPSASVSWPLSNAVC
jgi:hypothetical protein